MSNDILIKKYRERIDAATTSRACELVLKVLQRETKLPYDIKLGLLNELTYKILAFSAGVNGKRI
jgi:hypothetical protein